jgi:hypothetical protein
VLYGDRAPDSAGESSHPTSGNVVVRYALLRRLAGSREGSHEMANQQRDARSARPDVRGCLVACVVLVAAVAAYFELVQPLVQGDAPEAAVRHMCADVMRQDYVAAYALLSSGFIRQFQLNEDYFVQSQQGRDQQYGRVQACTVLGRDSGAALFTTGAVFQVTATLGGSSSTGPYTDTGSIGLVDEQGWKISDEQIDDILYFAG